MPSSWSGAPTSASALVRCASPDSYTLLLDCPILNIRNSHRLRDPGMRHPASDKSRQILLRGHKQRPAPFCFQHNLVTKK